MAVALLGGEAGIAQYSNERAADPLVAALCERISVHADASLRKDEARAVLLRAGQRFQAHVEHASGTAHNPMSDAAIEAKFLANARPALGEDRARRVAALVWQLGRQPGDVASLLQLCS